MSKTRAISGTPFTTYAIYRAEDGSVRQYSISHPLYGCLGTVSWHVKRAYRVGGYQRGLGAHSVTRETYPTLASAAQAFLDERKG